MNRFAPQPQRIQEKKPFTWSYSKLKNFEGCPKKHFEVDLAKNFEEVKGEALLYGDRFHDQMKIAVDGLKYLPDDLKDFNWLIDKLTLVSNPLQIIKVEQKLAITREFAPCGFFAKDVWFRGVIDYSKFVPVNETQQIAGLVDYKTGKPAEDPVQLALFAQLIFSHFPNTVKIRTDYFWTQAGAFSREDFTPADMVHLWTELNPRVAKLEQAYVTDTYPAVKSGLCKKHCPVLSCANNGRRDQ